MKAHSKIGPFTAGHISYVDNKTNVSVPAGGKIEKISYALILAHEFGHQYSLNHGWQNHNKWYKLSGVSKPVDYDENFASHFENIFREALKLPLRTHYSVFAGKPYAPSRLFWPGAGETWMSKSFPNKVYRSPRYF